MLYYAILYYSTRHNTALYYTVLYCTTLYKTRLYYSIYSTTAMVLDNTIHFAVLYYIVMLYTIRYDRILSFIPLGKATPQRAQTGLGTELS